MMATDSLELNTINEKKNAPPIKKLKRGKRGLQSTNSNGDLENGNGSLTESIPARLSKNSDTKRTNELNLETSTRSQLSDQNGNGNPYPSNSTRSPVESPQPTERKLKNTSKFQSIELTTATDEEDDDDEREQRKNIQPTARTMTSSDTMVQSYTSGENDIIEIHEFSGADIDAYLDIYFETLDNRLRHFIGDDDQLQQFRLAMKNRINSNTNSREYQNVLLGKMNGEVVAAVTLSFPGETTTISNDNILPQANSCFASVRRWMVRNANYIPTNMEECYIEMIGVKSAFRNHGIGAAMLECVEHFARQAGALLLTVHISGDQLRNYFQRFGFLYNNTDNSALWKWAVERQNIEKMSKMISANDENSDQLMENTNSYINGSMVESDGE